MRKLIAPVLALVCVALVMAAGVALLGQTRVRHPDADPAKVRAGAVLAYLRNGERFSLADAYPVRWDTVQFAPSWADLGRFEQLQLISYDENLVNENDPLMLLWRDTTLTEVHVVRENEPGYPRFRDALGDAAFSLERGEARFLCSFVQNANKRGGYYLCTPAGEET